MFSTSDSCFASCRHGSNTRTRQMCCYQHVLFSRETTCSAEQHNLILGNTPLGQPSTPHHYPASRENNSQMTRVPHARQCTILCVVKCLRQTQGMPKHTPRTSSHLAFAMSDCEADAITSAMTKPSAPCAFLARTRRALETPISVAPSVPRENATQQTCCSCVRYLH